MDIDIGRALPFLYFSLFDGLPLYTAPQHIHNYHTYFLILLGMDLAHSIQ